MPSLTGRAAAPLEQALTWIIVNQGPRTDRRNRGGWGYFSPGLRREDSYARVSITAWMVMALESARLSGIELPEHVLPDAKEYLENSFDLVEKPAAPPSRWAVPGVYAYDGTGVDRARALAPSSSMRRKRTTPRSLATSRSASCSVIAPWPTMAS